MGQGSQVWARGSTFRVKDKDGIEGPKSSLKMLIFPNNFDLCDYTSEHSTHEKERNYHESTKNGKHEKSVSNWDGFIACDACMCRSSGNHPQ